jgi:hypothetical protein
LTAFLVLFFLSCMFVTCPLLGCLWFVCLFFVARINNFHHGWSETFEASRHLAPDSPRHTVTFRGATVN